MKTVLEKNALFHLIKRLGKAHWQLIAAQPSFLAYAQSADCTHSAACPYM